MVNKHTKIIILAAAIFVAAFYFYSFDRRGNNFSGSAAPTAALLPNIASVGESTDSTEIETVYVLRVVDGDTIEVMMNGKKEKVRYIGVDTPESVDPRRAVGCFGREAAAANAALVKGKTAILVRDVSDRDKYGRLLRYVYLNDATQTFINLELVRAGYAVLATYPPDVAHAAEFRAAADAARAAQVGLWGSCSR